MIKHIYKLLSVLQLLEEWKEDTGGFALEFITQHTYEDLQWIVSGITGVAYRCLSPDKLKKMHQGRNWSDACKHFSAILR